MLNKLPKEWYFVYVTLFCVLSIVLLKGHVKDWQIALMTILVLYCFCNALENQEGSIIEDLATKKQGPANLPALSNCNGLSSVFEAYAATTSAPWLSFTNCSL